MSLMLLCMNTIYYFRNKFVYMYNLLYNFSPWLEAPYKDAAEKTPGGRLTINGFLSEVCMLAVMLTLN